MVTNNKPVYGQFDEQVAKLIAKNNAKAKATRQAVKTVSYVTIPEALSDDLFEDPVWQAALEAEVLARHDNGGQPL